MAFRYRQTTPQDGDIVDPADWNENQKELATEFNGMLDRDNFREEMFTQGVIKQHAFTKVQLSTVNNFIVYGHHTMFQTILSRTIEVETDAMVMAEWSAYWEFADSMSAETAASSTLDWNIKCVTFVMHINGVQAGVIFRGWDKFKDANIMYGCMPVSAGKNTIEIKCRSMELEHAGTPKVGEAFMSGANVTVKSQVLTTIIRKR